MTETGWGGDPGHSGNKPMMSLQGGMASPNTQAPITSEAMTGGRVSGTAESPGVAPTETIVGSGMHGGDTANRSSDSNGHRGRPSPA